MPRHARHAPGGIVYHVLNRGVGRMNLFDTPADFAAFEAAMASALEACPVRLLAYCLMPNHWHLVLWPRKAGELGTFMQRLTLTHASRWLRHRQAVGTGHVYQGRFKSFPVEADSHFLEVCRYVERNPLRAGLVERAEAWRWCSLWRRVNPAGSAPGNSGTEPGRKAAPSPASPAESKAEPQVLPELSSWPLDPPRDWLRRVNRPESPKDLEALRRCVARGRPYGTEAWESRTVKALGLSHTLRPRGRPRKQAGEAK